MDKTLSEGCLIEYKLGDTIFSSVLLESIDKYDEETDEYPIYTDMHWVWVTLRSEIDDIIWHYDITAVLKYIETYEDFYTEFDWPANRIEPFKFIITDLQDNIIWEMPNKPLHLYTEQEEKELLELLLKLTK